MPVRRGRRERERREREGEEGEREGKERDCGEKEEDCRKEGEGDRHREKRYWAYHRSDLATTIPIQEKL